MRGDDRDPRGLGDDYGTTARGPCSHRKSGEGELAREGCQPHRRLPSPAKSNRTSGMPLSWLLEHRSKCPEDVEPWVVEQYAMAYLWYILTEVVFPDCSGDIALWMYLDFLADWDAGYSWGAAGLAYLYRSVSEYHFLSNIRCVLLYILTSYCLDMVCSLTTRPRERKSRPVCVDVYGASPFGCGSESR